MRAISNFLERLETVSDREAFEKVCEDIVAGELEGIYQEFLDLFNRLVGTRNKILGAAGVFNRKATAAISHTFHERTRVAPTPRDKFGIRYPRLSRAH